MKFGNWLIFERESTRYATKNELKLLAEEFDIQLQQLFKRDVYQDQVGRAEHARETRAAMQEPFSEAEIMAMKTQLKAAGVDDKVLSIGEMALKSGAVNRKTISDLVKGLMR